MVILLREGVYKNDIFLGCLHRCEHFLFSFYRYWEGADVCTMLEDIDFMCEVLRILMEACTDNG